MKSFFAALAAAFLLVSCEREAASGSGEAVPTEPPSPPSAEVLDALKAQPFGKNLLGKTMMLAGESFVAADLQSAPQYYLVHYSASW